ncbi:hypothetical protein PoB_004001900 [Plakobranchus ocellatus]|uniref:Secreted protein n=1 Tax=Plakobranchus ocellatus TaxID=259542 RepID=A0AAV4B544_9GAST|nr:hypothetical protein PoB_004001900 [Plakobranchus ocellatus]
MTRSGCMKLSFWKLLAAIIRIPEGCAAKDESENDYVLRFLWTETMGRGNENMGVRACPAFLLDEENKTVLCLITAQLAPLALSLSIPGHFKGT